MSICKLPQVKDENWAGMFVDLRSNSRIEDRTVIRVEVEPEPMVRQDTHPFSALLKIGCYSSIKKC